MWYFRFSKCSTIHISHFDTHNHVNCVDHHILVLAKIWYPFNHVSPQILSYSSFSTHWFLLTLLYIGYLWGWACCFIRGSTCKRDLYLQRRYSWFVLFLMMLGLVVFYVSFLFVKTVVTSAIYEHMSWLSFVHFWLSLSCVMMVLCVTTCRFISLMFYKPFRYTLNSFGALITVVCHHKPW